MNDRFRVSKATFARLAEVGLSVSEVLRAAGLPEATLDEDKILLSTQELFALWRAVADVGGDPAIGLRLGRDRPVERYDPILLTALYSRSFREALERLARYKQLTCPEEIRLADRGGESAVQFRWLKVPGVEPPALLDSCFSWVVALGERGSGRPVVPLRVELKRPVAYRALIEEHFGCPVRFDCGRNALVFDRADMDRPFLTHNPELLGLIAPQLEALLREREGTHTLRERVAAVVKRTLAGRRPDMNEVARELGLSRRTLQRRLAGESVTFQQVLEDSRRELARHYLRQPSLELNETAYLLGYDDANSFFRAFRSWEGTSPGQWRVRQEAAR